MALSVLQAALLQRFGPQESVIRGSTRASQRRAALEIPTYFREYLARLGSPQQKGTLANQAVAGYQDAQSHLAHVGGGAGLISSSYGQLLNTLGANAGAYFSDKGRIGALQGIQAIQQENARTRGYRQQLSDLAAQKGAFAVTEQANEQAAAQKQALDVEKLNAQLAHYGAMERTARSNARTSRYRAEHPSSGASGELTAAKLAYFKKYGYLPPTGPPTKKGGYSGAKLQGFGESWDSALALAHAYANQKSYTNKAGKKVPITQASIYLTLIKKGIAPSIARGASFQAYGAPVDAQTAHELAVRGVHVPKA